MYSSAGYILPKLRFLAIEMKCKIKSSTVPLLLPGECTVTNTSTKYTAYFQETVVLQSILATPRKTSEQKHATYSPHESNNYTEMQDFEANRNLYEKKVCVFTLMIYENLISLSFMWKSVLTLLASNVM